MKLEVLSLVWRLDCLSCVLTVFSTILVGRRCWTGWALPAVNSLIICVVGLRTGKLGLIPANLFCIVLYAVNLRTWRKAEFSWAARLEDARPHLRLNIMRASPPPLCHQVHSITIMASCGTVNSAKPVWPLYYHFRTERRPGTPLLTTRFNKVAVGTTIADRPPRGSARALISACGSYRR
jgi:hypothetical protein